MGESCREILKNVDHRPIPRGCRQGAEIVIRAASTVCVFNQTRESFLCLSAAAAGDIYTAPGEGREPRTIGREDGVWLAPSPGLYTVGTLFPTDRVYLDRRKRVIQLIEHLDPLQIVPVRCRYASVLEVKARTIFSSGTRLGDQLLICPPEDVGTHWKQIQEQIACL